MKTLQSVLAMGTLIGLIGCQQQPQHKPLEEPRTVKGDVVGTLGNEPDNWFTLAPQDGVEGVGSDRAYTELGLKTGVAPIVVAVIDSGVDITHEDLQGKIWVNPGETGLDALGNSKETNNIDDDGNGYVDDVHGWNFLGSHDGKNVDATTLEITRELVRMEALKASRGGQLSGDEEAYLAQLLKDFNEAVTGATDELNHLNPIKAELETQFKILESLFTKKFEELLLADVQDLKVTAPGHVDAKAKMLKIMKDNGIGSIPRLLRVIERYSDELNYYYNKSFDPRKEIIGDDPYDFSDTNYGNNDVKGPDASHGTHVAGIIAAIRDNGIGIRGVAEDVKIMSLRAVPNGDEYDKDVANAVKYAVRNGARIINMSFGKGYSSPYKEEVDKAFLEASAKGALIIHSAGNSNQNNDVAPNFPNRKLKQVPGGVISTWLEIGASSAEKGQKLPAYFSNYGPNSVDIFSPGFNIKSSVPDGNQYAIYSGTSMASPVISGVAALALAQKPLMSGQELKQILMKNSRQYPGLQVLLPNDPSAEPKLVLFETLSISGGIVDAFETLKEVMGL